MKTLLLLFIGLSPSLALGSEPASRLWGIGLQTGFFEVPTGNLGLPLDEVGIPFDGPAEIVVRREFEHTHTALNLGLGFPHDALGMAVWVGFEIYLPVAGDPQAFCALELYADPGVQLGFAGPDYFARRSGVFVGYEYGLTGPLALALRNPVGARWVLPRLRLDVFVEAAPLVTFTPAFEPFFITLVGVRFRL